MGSGIYVTCAYPYRNVSVRLWKIANGRKYATPQGISFRFNEWNEFIKMYSEYSEIYTCEPCILDQDRSGHDVNTGEECKADMEVSCKGEVTEDIPL